MNGGRYKKIKMECLHKMVFHFSKTPTFSFQSFLYIRRVSKNKNKNKISTGL
jgi:hypothetical protein